MTTAPAPPPAPWKLRLIRHPLVGDLHSVFCRAAMGCRLENRPELPAAGPVIFAGNHGSHFDFLLLHEFLCRMLKRRVRGVAWDGMARIPWVRLYFHGFGAVPGSGNEKEILAVRRLVRALRAGTDLWVQCEGARYDTLAPFKPGAAIASLIAGRPIVPFSLRGVQPLFKNLPWPNRLWGNVSMRFHRPLHPQTYLEKGGDLRGAALRMTTDLRALVASGIDYPDGMASATPRDG